MHFLVQFSIFWMLDGIYRLIEMFSLLGVQAQTVSRAEAWKETAGWEERSGRRSGAQCLFTHATYIFSKGLSTPKIGFSISGSWWAFFISWPVPFFGLNSQTKQVLVQSNPIAKAEPICQNDHARNMQVSSRVTTSHQSKPVLISSFGESRAFIRHFVK
jgi:hypothetical protein